MDILTYVMVIFGCGFLMNYVIQFIFKMIDLYCDNQYQKEIKKLSDKRKEDESKALIERIDLLEKKVEHLIKK